MTSSLSPERRGATAAILAEITRLGLDRQLKITGVDGTKPIVIAFGDESIGDVFTRIMWSAGFANLFVVMGENDIALVSVLPPASALTEREAEPLELTSAASPISMLVEASKRAGGASFNIRISFDSSSSAAKIEAVEDASELAPAN